MLLKLQKYFSQIKPVTVDGALYVLIAVFGTCITVLNSDDAYKYFNPYVLYYSKAIGAILLAAVSALKMFRSTSYSEHLDAKKDASLISSSAIVEASGDTVLKTSQSLEQKKE